VEGEPSSGKYILGAHHFVNASIFSDDRSVYRQLRKLSRRPDKITGMFQICMQKFPVAETCFLGVLEVSDHFCQCTFLHFFSKCSYQKYLDNFSIKNYFISGIAQLRLHRFL
jgi:hypothetical protein